MPKNETHTSQYHDSIFLHKWKMLKFKIAGKNNWNTTNKPLLADLKLPKKRKNPYKSEFKGISLLIGVLALLSIGMCIQADSLAQTLRVLVRISVQKTIPMK